MKSYFLTSGLCAMATAVLVACGGGGDDQTMTDLQAKQLAARTVSALFVATDVVAQVMANNLGASTEQPLAFGAQSANCTEGSGDYSLIDGDANGVLSAGDQARYQLSGCRTQPNAPWTYNGAAVLTVSQAPAADPVVAAGTARRLGLTISADVMEFATQSYFVGEMALRLAEASGSTEFAFADSTVTFAQVPVHFEGVRFVNNTQVVELSGRVRTQIDGIDEVVATLSLDSPLTLQSSTGKVRPTGGAVRVSTERFQMVVSYGEQGQVLLTIGAIGSELEPRLVNTTRDELDQLLGVGSVAAPMGDGTHCLANGRTTPCVQVP
jgi:hypothetical protein